MSRPRPLATLLLLAGAAASVATSQPGPPLGGSLEASAEGPALVLGTEAGVTITAALDEEAVSPDAWLWGALRVQTTACVPAIDAPGRLRASLIPELPLEGAVLEMDVPACPGRTALTLDVPLWSSCAAGQPCAERFALRYERLDAAHSGSALTLTFQAHATASGYPEGEPVPGASLTLVIQ